MITSCKKQKAYHWFLCVLVWLATQSKEGEKISFCPFCSSASIGLDWWLAGPLPTPMLLFQDTVPERGCVDRLHLAGSENMPCVRKSVLIWKCLRGLVCLMKMYWNCYLSYHCIYIFISNLSCSVILIWHISVCKSLQVLVHICMLDVYSLLNVICFLQIVMLYFRGFVLQVCTHCKHR